MSSVWTPKAILCWAALILFIILMCCLAYVRQSQLQAAASLLVVAPEHPSWWDEPQPQHRVETPVYWQQFCRQTYGTAVDGPGIRQRALDWADHCTMAGDFNGKEPQ